MVRFTRETRNYSFLLIGAHGPIKTVRQDLLSDIDASVVTFDLMAADPRILRIEVERGGRVGLARRRVEGKTELDWL